MRLDGRRESDNVEDVRNQGAGRRGGGIALSGAGTLIVLIAAYFMGINPIQLLQEIEQSPAPPRQHEPAPRSPEDEKTIHMVKKVLAGTEDVWAAEFKKMGRRYEPPMLKIFSGGIRSGCGQASSQMGPFYCPADRTVYLDLEFFHELHRRFGAPGDFAQAYVIAHEVSHHVQNLLGISDQVHRAQQGSSKSDANALSVRLELQADFLAGMWAHKWEESASFLDPGDLEEALRAAQAIGDDTLQKQAQGYIVPDAFTHGSSAQRVRWFKRGFESEHFDPNNTFLAKDL